MKTKFNSGDLVEGGKPGSEDYDTGEILDHEEDDDIPSWLSPTEIGTDFVLVAWSNGEVTWTPISELRRV